MYSDGVEVEAELGEGLTPHKTKQITFLPFIFIKINKKKW